MTAQEVNNLGRLLGLSSKITDRFEIVEKVGSGGFGAIYQVKDKHNSNMNGQANFDYQCSLPVSNGTSVKVDDQQKLIKEKFTKDNYNSLLLAASTDTKFASWKLAEIFKESEFNKKCLFGNDSLNTDIQSDISWASVQGIDNRLTLVAPWHQENSNGYVQNYVNSYKAKFIGEKDGLNWRSAMAYDATLALMAALDTLNFSSDQDINKNREVVSDALKNVVIPADQAATGTVRFTEKGDRDISASPNLVGYIVQAKKTGDKFTYICIDGDGCDSSATTKTDPQ